MTKSDKVSETECEAAHTLQRKCVQKSETGGQRERRSNIRGHVFWRDTKLFSVCFRASMSFRMEVNLCHRIK